MTAVYSGSSQYPVAGPMTVHIQMFVSNNDQQGFDNLPNSGQWSTSDGMPTPTVVKLRHRVIAAALNLATETEPITYTRKWRCRLDRADTWRAGNPAHEVESCIIVGGRVKTSFANGVFYCIRISSMWCLL